jgi:hypothetical protein
MATGDIAASSIAGIAGGTAIQTFAHGTTVV